jgi:hypothetical protein
VWELSAIRVIVTNPRYTGRQVWNKQRTDEVLLDVEDVALGHEAKQRWNSPQDWVWSAQVVHTPLISAEVFERVQRKLTVRGVGGDSGNAPRRSTRPYLFRGLLRCGLCGRRMEGSFNHGRLYYRCAASRDFVRQHKISHPPCLYLREESIVSPVDRFLHQELGTARLHDTLRRLSEAQHRAVAALEDADQRTAELRQTVADCDKKINNYRAALDAGGDPALIAGWIKETAALRSATQTMIGAQRARPERMTEDQIGKIVDGLGGLLGLLHEADPRDRAEVYARIGLRLTYQPGPETVIAEVASPAIDGVDDVCPRPYLQRTHPRRRGRPGSIWGADRLWFSAARARRPLAEQGIAGLSGARAGDLSARVPDPGNHRIMAIPEGDDVDAREFAWCHCWRQAVVCDDELEPMLVAVGHVDQAAVDAVSEGDI